MRIRAIIKAQKELMYDCFAIQALGPSLGTAQAAKISVLPALRHPGHENIVTSAGLLNHKTAAQSGQVARPAFEENKPRYVTDAVLQVY